MKKIFALLLVLFILPVAAFADVAEPGTFPIVDEEITLTVMACINTACDSWKNNTTMLEYEKQTGIKIEWIEVADADIVETIRRSLIAGDCPDVVLWWFPDTAMVQSFGSNGDILPLNDLIENYTVNAKQQLIDNPHLKDIITSGDGNIYTLWRVQESPNETVWNKQFLFLPWFEQYKEATGVDHYPETLDEYRALLEYFRDHDMNGNGDTTDEIPLLGNAAAAIEGGSSMGYIMSAFQLWNCHDYYHITEDGQLVFEANTKEYRDGLSWINKLYEDGLYSEEDFILNLTDYRATTSKATPEEIIVGLAAAPFYMRAVTQSIYERAYVDFEAIPPLKNAYDENVRETYQRSDALYYPSCFISANCKNPEAAIEWLDYWLGQEGTMKTTWYGIEGRDWEYTDEFKSLVGETPSILVKASLEGSGNTEVPAHTGVPTYVTRALFEQTAVDPNSNGRTYPDYRAHMNYDAYCVKGNIPEIVWCADEDLLAEYSELNTTIGEYVRASYASFILGKTDIDNDADWQAYLDGLEDLGLTRYLEVLNTYYGL